MTRLLILAAFLAQLRADLVEEAMPSPGTDLRYGRPHAHPRARYYPRYSPTGERLAGSVVVRPDCPRPVRGRCECPPDGSWRPVVGVVRADTTATHAAQVPASRLRLGLAGTIWVDEVYELGADGLWRCRWPVRRALEQLRGQSPARWATAIALLRGTHVSNAWGANGAPPNPIGEAMRLLQLVDRRAQEERVTEWERRPRQWWDPPKKPNARALPKSDAQVNAEHESNGGTVLTTTDAVATLPPVTGAPIGPRSVTGVGPRASRQRPTCDFAPSSATASLPEAACA